MAYESQHDGKAGVVREVAMQVRAQHPDAWQALDTKSSRFVRLVVAELRRRGIEAACNGKRGNPNDLSCDVVNFVNDTGARDTTGTVSGIELRDFIAAAEDPVGRHLDVFGDATPVTIANTQAAWVVPDGAPGVPSPVPGPVPADPVAKALQQIAEMHPVIMGLKKYL